jgi:hypothetical protein
MSLLVQDELEWQYQQVVQVKAQMKVRVHLWIHQTISWFQFDLLNNNGGEYQHSGGAMPVIEPGISQPSKPPQIMSPGGFIVAVKLKSSVIVDKQVIVHEQAQWSPTEDRVTSKLRLNNMVWSCLYMKKVVCLSSGNGCRESSIVQIRYQRCND